MTDDQAHGPYDEGAYDSARRVRPRSFDQRFALFDSLDKHFTNVWLNYTGRLFARDQLDLRTRLLVLTAQYTMTGNQAALADTLQAGLDEDVDPRELLEVILQCYVYGAESPVSDAAEMFARVMEDAGRLDEVRQRSLPVDASTRDRSLEEERKTWSSSDADDPRLPDLLSRYGWTGISTGLRLRPGHHLNLVATLDAIDPEFLSLWLATTYEGMYSRGVLDDRTRLLCVVGGCLAVGETHQSRRHMRGALRRGATPRELLEVVFQSCAIAGHPHLMPMAIDDIVMLLDELGRLHEIVGEESIDQVRRIATARAERRHGIAELSTQV
ncbi:MAG: hypothetical protein GEU93_00615 [Propionibacteriales bacterium]|nr:hypothetical protein [Propionibacteriales bacterium]